MTHPLRHCLLSIITDQVKLNELQNQVENNLIDITWKHYFVSQNE